MDYKRQRIETYIELELQMSALYRLYQKLFPQDAEFWKRMAEEELRHAKVLEALFTFPDKFPENLDDVDLANLNLTVREIKEIIAGYKKNRPTRFEAYKKAIYVENVSGELHYRQVANQKNDPQETECFRLLNGGDKVHSESIAMLLLE
ncbi:MAG: ferritin family protein [Candidatus Omnitrophica bacterium]|nr:ferritin family protein [Candidatus Omnitrophota bacterium]